MKQRLFIFLLFILAFTLRIYGINWDQGNHLHPDERFLTMVAADIKLPSSISQYFDTLTSPLNPGNYPNYQFFVYGTFPLFLTKYLSHIFNQDNYDQVIFWGRGLSALFDSFNIFLLYFLAKKIIKSKFVFLPSLLYAFTVLPLQLSHFFAVDTFLNTFLLATFTLLSYNLFLPAFVIFGLALACKISALFFVPIIIFFFFKEKKNIFKIIFYLLITFIIFRVFQPYSFDGFLKINPHFIANLQTLQSENNPDTIFPPSIQWLSKIPLLFSLQNILFWGLGLPLSVIFVISIFKNKFSLPLFWILLIYFYQGSQFAHTMRYFLFIYPFICLLAGIYLATLPRKILILVVVCHLLSGFLFLGIYSRPHSRVQVSEWISQNIPPGSLLTTEYWDDALPLNNSAYSLITIKPYDPDSPDKINELMSQINSAGYIVMSSNRLWGSIPLVPQKYPLTSKFYQDLFAGKLKFSKTIEINSYPGISLPFLKKCYYVGPTNFPGIQNNWFAVDSQCYYPGLYFRDDTAEEAFTVYDHPKVLIFSRQNK